MIVYRLINSLFLSFNKYYLMNDQSECQIQSIKTCQCQLCNYKRTEKMESMPSDVGTNNNMDQFIKMMPLGFPLGIQQTMILHKRDEGGLQYHSYFNPQQDERKKFNIMHQSLRGMSTLSTLNVQLYFANNEKILTKFQATNLISTTKGEGILYIQPYEHFPAIRIEYPSQLQKKFDNILREYLVKQSETYKEQPYKLNQEFLQWVNREYGEQVFFYFLTQLYVRIIRVKTNRQIQRAIFFWIAEKSTKDIRTVPQKSSQREKYNAIQEMGRPRRLNFKPKLLNVRNLKVQKIEQLYSFEEEYQSLIKSKIASSTSKKTISAVKNKAYRGRLQAFRSKIQEVYHHQQKKIMGEVTQQKQFQYQVDSDYMAKLLIPNLGNYQNLRQVLNNQQAFREVFLTKKKDRNVTLPTLYHTNFQRRKSLKKNPESIIPNTLVKRRYQKLLTTPSTHQ